MPFKQSKHMLCLRVLLISLTALAISVPGQEQQRDTKVVKGDANACELNSLYLDYLAQDARASSERVFVIARLGRGEKNRALNRMRLSAARFSLAANRELKKETLVFAEGEQTEKEGRLEFYLGSKLYLISLVARGKNVCLTCCG